MAATWTSPDWKAIVSRVSKIQPTFRPVMFDGSRASSGENAFDVSVRL